MQYLYHTGGIVFCSIFGLSLFELGGAETHPLCVALSTWKKENEKITKSKIKHQYQQSAKYKWAATSVALSLCNIVAKS